MSNPAIYIAGPVQYSDDSDGYRDLIKEGYHQTFDLIDPLDKYDTDTDSITWESPRGREGGGGDDARHVLPEDIIAADKELIRDSDGMLIVLRETMEYDDDTVPVPTYGVQREHEFAISTGTPVAVWYSDDIDTLPVWLCGETEWLSTSLQSCMDTLRAVHETHWSAHVNEHHDRYMDTDGIARTQPDGWP